MANELLTIEHLQKFAENISTYLGVNSNIYSLEEKQIGLWVDGKSLYKKSFYIPALPSSKGIGTYPTQLSDIDKCWIYDGFIKAPSGIVFPLNIARPDANLDDQIGCSLSAGFDIRFHVGYDRSSLYAYVTLCYTKTTD